MKATVKQQILLMDFLLQALGSSKNAIRQMLRFSRVTVDDKVVSRADLLLEPGQVVKVGSAVKPEADQKKVGPSEIKYEDDSIIVVEKPAGLLSISTDREKRETLHSLLYGYMQAKEQGRVYIVHRLDRDVAGLMVLAKTSSAKTNLQLNWDQAQKRYMALVVGKPPEPKGRIELWLEEESTFKMRVTRESETSKLSITEYQVLEELEGHTLLDINLLTGRRHQIRISLAHMGCPIVGDRVYGTPIPFRTEIHLFAYSLSFRHPVTGKILSFKSVVPKSYKTPPKQPKARKKS